MTADDVDAASRRYKVEKAEAGTFIQSCSANVRW